MGLNRIWRTQLGTIHTDETLGVTSDSEGNIIIAGYTTGELVRGQAQGGYDAWLVKLAADGHEQWRKQFGTKLTDQGLSVASNRKGEIAVAGYTTGEFAEGEAQGGYDAWVAKFAGDGQEIWRHQVGTAAEDTAYGVAFDKDNNVFIAGYTSGDMVENANKGGFDAWLAKFDSDGKELWRKQIGTEADEDAHDVSADSEGNVAIVGYTGGELARGEHVGGYDGWVAKLNSAGDELWRRQLGSIKGDKLCSVVFDSGNNVVVTGHTAGEIVAGEAQGGYDAWVAKFTPDGELIWQHQVGTEANNDARSVGVNSKDEVFIVGYSFSKETSNANVWIVKFDAGGNELWREILKSVDDEAAHSIAIDKDDHIIIGGYTTSPANPFTSAWVAKFNEAN